MAMQEKKTIPTWLHTPLMFSFDGDRHDLRREHIDIAEMVRQVKQVNGTVLRLAALKWRGYVYYQSEIAPHEPGLGTYDWQQAARSACSEHGIKLVTYFNPKGVLPTHPLFPRYAVRRLSGEYISSYGDLGGYWLCVNSPFSDYLVELVTEVVRKYQPDGIYFDGLLSTVCYCPYCRNSFKELSGSEIPPEFETWRSAFAAGVEVSGNISTPGNLMHPLAGQYGQFLADSTTDLTRRLYQAARAEKADLAVMFHTFPTRENVAWYDGTLIEYFPLRGPELWRTAEWSSYGNVYPVPTFMNVGYVGTGPELRHRAAQALAFGCFPSIIHMPTYDYRALADLGPLFAQVQQNSVYYSFANTEPLGFALLPRRLRNSAVEEHIEKNYPVEIEQGDAHTQFRPGDRFVGPYRGMFAALLFSGIPVRTVHLQQLAQYLPSHQVLLLANTTQLSNSDAAMIRDFVAAGGGLIATHEASLFDENGQKRDNFVLADLFGVDYIKTKQFASRSRHWNSPATYLQLAAGQPLPVDIPAGLLLPNYDRLVFCQPKKAGEQICATLVEPHEARSSYIMSVGDPTERPAIVCNTYGSGRVVYFANRPDAGYIEAESADWRRLLGAAVRWVVKDQMPVVVESDGLVAVNIMVQEKAWIVHLLNYTVAYQPPLEQIPALSPFIVRLRVPAALRDSRVRSLMTGEPCHVDRLDDVLVVQVPALRDYDALIVEPA